MISLAMVVHQGRDRLLVDGFEVLPVENFLDEFNSGMIFWVLRASPIAIQNKKSALQKVKGGS